MIYSRFGGIFPIDITIRNPLRIEKGYHYGGDFQDSLGVDPSYYPVKNLCSDNLLNIFFWGVLLDSL